MKDLKRIGSIARNSLLCSMGRCRIAKKTNNKFNRLIKYVFRFGKPIKLTRVKRNLCKASNGFSEDQGRRA